MGVTRRDVFSEPRVIKRAKQQKEAPPTQPIRQEVKVDTATLQRLGIGPVAELAAEASPAEPMSPVVSSDDDSDTVMDDLDRAFAANTVAVEATTVEKAAVELEHLSMDMEVAVSKHYPALLQPMLTLTKQIGC